MLLRIVLDEHGLESAVLRAALREWIDCKAGDMPPAGSLGTVDFAPEAAHHCMVVHVEGPEHFRIEAAGSSVYPVLRQQVEGLRVAELPPGGMRTRLRRLFTRTAQARLPIVDRRAAPATATEPGYEILVLPFLGSFARIDRLLAYVAQRNDDADKPPEWKPSFRQRHLDD